MAVRSRTLTSDQLPDPTGVSASCLVVQRSPSSLSLVCLGLCAHFGTRMEKFSLLTPMGVTSLHMYHMNLK